MEKSIKVWTNGKGIAKYNGQDKRTYSSNHCKRDGYKIMIAKLYEIDVPDIDVANTNNRMSCGNCKSFKNEDIEGVGWCKEFDNRTTTNEYCERWDEKDG